ncbi:MAG: hypothetical protein ACJAVT_001173, partial [Yoonia sp.]
MVAARAIADRNTFGHRSYRVAIRRQSFRRPNIISIRLRVTSRTVVWLFLKQFRFECVPVLHSLQGRLAA